MLDFIKKHKYLFISFGIVILIFSYFIIFNDSIFLFAGDSYDQQYKFYVEAWNRLRDGSLPFWNWSNFLGNNYYGSNTFYFLGSPFFWLAMLLPKVEWMHYVFVYLNLIKSLICLIFTYMWLNKVYKCSFSSSIGALIVTFSGFVLVNYSNNHIFDAISFIPLCLFCIECFIQDKKYCGLFLSIGYLGIINYYFLYLFLPFASIYTLIRYFVCNKNLSVKNTLKDASVFFACVVLGVAISAITLIPSYLALQGNPRSSELIFSLNTIGKQTYYRFLTSFLIPICDWRTNLNFFVCIDVNSGIGWGGGFADYSLILSIFCLPLLLFVKNKKQKMDSIFLLVIYFAFALFPFFYILFNQNYETRWFYIFTFIMAFVVSAVLKNRNDIPEKTIIINGVLCILLLCFCTYFSINFNISIISWEIDILKRNCIVLVLVLILYIFIFTVMKTGKHFQTSIFIVVFIEIIYSFIVTFYSLDDFNQPIKKQDFIEKYDIYNGAVKTINDNSFYRIDKDEVFSLHDNDAYLQRYNSFYGYHSLYNYNQNKFIWSRFMKQGLWSFNVQTGKDILKTMLGSKYWFTYKKEDEYIIPYGYSYYAKSDDGATIYKNDYPITFAYFRDKTTTTHDKDSLDIFHQDYLMLDHVVLDDALYSDLNLLIEPKIIKEYGGEKDRFDIEEDHGYVYVVYKNENIYDKEKYTYPYWIFNLKDKNIISSQINNELSYVGLPLSEKIESLSCNHITSTTIYYDDMSWYDDWYNSQVMVDPDTVIWDDNSISGTITTEKEGYIVTSVPYDKGWTVKLDGKKIDYLKVNEGFVGFTITKGTHTIEMNYVPPGLVVGSIISFVSLVLCLFLRKKRKVL